MQKSSFIVTLFALTACPPSTYAGDAPLALTIDAFVTRAIKQGIQSRLNNLTIEAAGYTRDIAFRQTDSPTFDFNQVTSRGETTLNGFPELSNSETSNLVMNEIIPFGTNLNVTGQWTNSGGTLGPSLTVPLAEPGFTANLTQPIYIFVKNPILRTRRSADLSFANAKAFFQTTTLSLRAQARSLYYNVMLDDESIRADERKVASSQKLLAVTQALVDAGRSAPVETMRARIQLQDDQRQLQNDQVLKQQALLQAKNFIYLPLDVDVHFITALEFAPFRVPLPRLLDYAILHNPTLESLRNLKVQAHLNYQAAVEPTRPTLSLNGVYNASDSGTQPDLQTHGWTLTSTINWLFFDSFVTRDQARNARIAEWVADLNLQDAERTTRVNVQSQYLDIKRTEKQIEDFKFSKEQAERNVETLRIRFQNGLTSILDVLNSEDQERGLDAEYLSLLVRFNTSKDQLSQQLGADVESLL